MSYFPGVFITQYHKSRAGYFINHDLLMNGTAPHTQPPPKLATNSSSTLSLRMSRRNSTTQMPSSTSAKGTHSSIPRNSRFGNSITLWTYATFFGILLPTAAIVLQRRRKTAIRDIAVWTALAGYTATVVNSTLWRTNEARMLESSDVIQRLVHWMAFRRTSITSASSTSHSPKRRPMFKNCWKSMIPIASASTIRDHPVRPIIPHPHPFLPFPSPAFPPL